MGSKKHGLQIIDSDAHFTVDPITRNITNDESTKNTILQGDHNSERFTFKIPRYIDGHDMSTCDNVRVAYINTEVSGRDRKHGTGVYLVSDLAIDPTNDKFVTCSWLISKNATMYTGVLNFMLIFSCMDGELVKYRWKTNVFESINVALSLDADLIFEAEYLDVIEQWKNSVKNEFSVYLEDSAKQHYGEFKDILHEEMATEFDAMQEELDAAFKTKSDSLDEQIDGFDEILRTEITNMDGEIDTLKSRMNTFTSLPEGSTTGDAELADIRVGADGATYDSAGEAVRGQVENVTKSAIAAQTIFTNVFPTLVENTKVLTVNGGASEVAETLDVRVVSNTNYGAYYVNRYIPSGYKKLIILQKVKLVSGSYSNYPHVYCYGADNKMIDGATRIYRGSIDKAGVEYYVNCVRLVENTTSIGIGSYSMKEGGICETDVNPVVFDVTELSDEHIATLYDLLMTGFVVDLYDNWSGNVPYHVYHSIESDHAKNADKAEHATLSDSAHSCYLAEPPKKEPITEASGWNSNVTTTESGFNVSLKETWGGVGFVRDFIVGRQYLVIWQGSFADKVGFIKSSGSAWNHMSSVKINVNGDEYYYGFVSAMEDDILNRIIIHTKMDAESTITNVSVTEINPLVVINSDLVRTVIMGDAIYIPALKTELDFVKSKSHDHAWFGKNVLFMGDSLTAAGKYQKTIADTLGINVHNHCLGGAGIIQIVDGNTAGTISAITADTVRGMDLIVFYAGYNNRGTVDGKIGDCYVPGGGGQNTIAGYMQYAINRIYQCLADAGNLACKILIVTVDCAGKYEYIDADGYAEYPAKSGQTMETLANIQKSVAEYNALACCDLWHTSGINSNTWSIFGANPNAYVENPGESSAPYPHNGDQLHKSDSGYKRIGEVICGAINKAYGV